MMPEDTILHLYDHLEDDLSQKRALLVSIYNSPGEIEACNESLDELELLAKTYGVKVIEKVPCQLRKFSAATYFTTGKVNELVAKAIELNVELIIIDEEISPAQQRNLEKFFDATVMDRTEVILGVFAHRAQTREARLQIELARVQYEAPRLKRMWTHLSRQAATAGGGKYLKGVGEKQIEIDRRLLKKRISQLRNELKNVRHQREVQRSWRIKAAIPTFAIIGYTNAGKSTLINALTDAGVFVEDKLFATLDTTTRKFTLKNNQEILLIDTVGFIRKLPHNLVAAFKSTLEEAVFADILLHIVDVSHPNAKEHAETSLKVLEELGAKDKAIITVLNKIDLCEEQGDINELRLKYPKTLRISALEKIGFDELQDAMIQEIAKLRKEVHLRIPQKEYSIVSEVRRYGKVLKEDYDENDVILRAEVPVALSGKLEKYCE